MQNRIGSTLSGILVFAGIAAITQQTVFAQGDKRPVWQEPAPITPKIAPLPKGATAQLGNASQWYVHAISSDGKLLAAGDWKHVYLWDAHTGKRLRTLDGSCVGTISRSLSHTGEVAHAMPGIAAAAFSPDGTVLATGGADGSLHFWNTATGKQIGKPQAHGDSVRTLRFTSDGKSLFSAGYEPQLWDVESQKVLRTFSTNVTPVAHNIWHATLSPDGKTAAAVSYNHLYIWNVADAKLLHTITHNRSASEVVFSADGTTVIANRTAFPLADPPPADLQRWDVATGKPLESLPAKEKHIFRRGRFSNDGRFMAWMYTGHLVFSGHQGLLHVSDVASGKELLCREVGWNASFVLSADGKTMAVGEGKGNMYLVDVTTGKKTVTFAVALQPLVAMSFADDGRNLLTLTADGMMHDWNAAKAIELRRLPLPLAEKEMPHSLSPDGKQVALVDAKGNLRLWSVADRRELWKQAQAVSHFDRPALSGPFLADDALPQARRALEFSRDGRALVGLGDAGKRMTVWETATGKKLHEWKGMGLQAVALSPDAKTLAVGVAQGKRVSLGVVDLASGKEKRRFTLAAPGPTGNGEVRGAEIINILMSPDGKTIAVVEETVTYQYASRMNFYGQTVAAQRIHVFKMDGRKDPSLIGSSGSAIAFSPNSGQLAYLKPFGQLAIHDVAGNVELKMPAEWWHQGASLLAFSPDGQTLASSSGGAVLMWDVRFLLEDNRK